MGHGSELPALWRVVVAPPAWGVSAALIGVMLLLATVEPHGTSPARFVLFAVAPACVLGITLTVLATQQRWLALGALLLAVSPTVVTASAASLLPGAVAVLVASGVVLAITLRLVRGPAQGWGIVLVGAVVAVVSWRVAGPPVGDPLPLHDALGRTGQSLASITGAIARDGVPAHTSAFLLWWLALGVLVGAALIFGRRRDGAAIPLTVAVLGAISVIIVLQRGTFDGRYLNWVLAAAISYTGAVLAAPVSLARRLGVALAGLAMITWVAGVARMAQVDAPTTLLLTARIAAAMVLIALGFSALAVVGRRTAVRRP